MSMCFENCNGTCGQGENNIRKMKFSEVIGQDDVRVRLIQMVREERVPHAIMFCGPHGSGKMAVAMAFASYLLGEGREPEDGTEMLGEASRRNVEAMLAKWSHPDLHFSYPVIRPSGMGSEHKMTSDDFGKEWKVMLAGGPYFTIDKWLGEMNAANQQAQIGVGESDSIIRKLSLKSSQGGYKVCIIWLPERMNSDCANKLLKILEEPPHRTVFMMVCEEPEKLLETIRSRTQRIDIRRISTDDIARALTERRLVDADTAARIARVSDGSWIKALEELDAGNENRTFLDMFIMLMRLAYRRDIKSLKKWSEAVSGYGREKQKRMLAYFLRLIRENFMYNFSEPELVYMTRDEEDFARNFARFINEANIMELSELYGKAIRDIGQNANSKIVFFDIALNTIVMLVQGGKS